MEIVVKNESPKEIEMLSRNEFTKVFKYKNEVDMFVSKAIDEEIDKHYFVVSIPDIPETRTLQLTYPWEFDTPEERDFHFEAFDEAKAQKFMEDLIEHIKKQNEINNEAQRKADEKKKDEIKAKIESILGKKIDG
jgi:hypothetical protein